MPRERTLVAAAVVVVALALLSAAVFPGVVADPRSDRPERVGHVSVAEVTPDVGHVSGETAEIVLRTRLRHGGPPTDNVSVRFRAIDAESGLLETERVVDVGTVDTDGEIPVNATLTVEREGGYRLEIVVFHGDERIDIERTGVQGLSALTPAYARTSVGFTEGDPIPAVSPSVVEADENRTTLSIETSLTNRGDNVSNDLSVTIVLRQAESNLVAAERTVSVGDIRPGRTDSVAAEVTVPSEYNYYVDAILKKDGVVVDTARSAVNLDPTRTIQPNETREDVEFSVSDFEEERTPRPEPTREPRAGTESSAPGFGPILALVAMLGVAALARRRSP